MTEPQVWVLMGIFATAVFGMLGWQTVTFNRTIESLRRELQAFRESFDAKFDVVNHKIDGLDRDVQLLMRREFGVDRD